MFFILISTTSLWATACRSQKYNLLALPGRKRPKDNAKTSVAQKFWGGRWRLAIRCQSTIIKVFRHLFWLFSFFSQQNSNTNWKKHRCCAWDSNPGPQDGRHRRIHWAIAADHQCFFLFFLFSSMGLASPPTPIPWPVWPDWAIYWTFGNFLKPLATINLPKSPTF